ncbi:hypothetical protein PAMA_011306 [Pampus argenteus]
MEEGWWWWCSIPCSVSQRRPSDHRRSELLVTERRRGDALLRGERILVALTNILNQNLLLSLLTKRIPDEEIPALYLFLYKQEAGPESGIHSNNKNLPIIFEIEAPMGPTQKSIPINTVIFMVPAVGFFSFTVQNDAEFETRRLISHSSAEGGKSTENSVSTEKKYKENEDAKFDSTDDDDDDDVPSTGMNPVQDVGANVEVNQHVREIDQLPGESRKRSREEDEDEDGSAGKKFRC